MTKHTRQECLRLSPTCQKAMIVAIAGFLTPFYRWYESGPRYKTLVRQIDCLWNSLRASSPNTGNMCNSTETIAATVPDVDKDPSEHAGVAQVAALSVASATEAVTRADCDPQRLWEYFDEARDHLLEGDSDEADYSNSLRELQGRSISEITAAIESLNNRPSRSQRAQEIGRVFGNFEKSLLRALLADRSTDADIVGKCWELSKRSWDIAETQER